MIKVSKNIPAKGSIKKVEHMCAGDAGVIISGTSRHLDAIVFCVDNVRDDEGKTTLFSSPYNNNDICVMPKTLTDSCEYRPLDININISTVNDSLFDDDPNAPPF